MPVSSLSVELIYNINIRVIMIYYSVYVGNRPTKEQYTFFIHSARRDTLVNVIILSESSMLKKYLEIDLIKSFLWGVYYDKI